MKIPGLQGLIVGQIAGTCVGYFLFEGFTGNTKAWYALAITIALYGAYLGALTLRIRALDKRIRRSEEIARRTR